MLGLATCKQDWTCHIACTGQQQSDICQPYTAVYRRAQMQSCTSNVVPKPTKAGMPTHVVVYREALGDNTRMMLYVWEAGAFALEVTWMP